jgi:aspartyl-tRNA(Asn)/glutamyl-tRNA(Gln) amidotransferase subunit A
VTIAETFPRLGRGEIKAERITEECLARIAALNPTLNAFITVTADEALAAAREADREIAAGRHRGPLHGIPVSLKDLVDQRGIATTAASKVRHDHVAAADAPVTARLREAGAIFVGKTNLHEFAFGTTSSESAFGPARHPADPARSPGGSSGGSAIAIATGMSLGTVGTDTGGSIRIPSAACGVVGLKPTWGEIPAAGVVPLSRQLDHVGPLARSVTDAWLQYDAMRARTACGPASLEAATARRLRFGVPEGYLFDRLDLEVERGVRAAIESLRRAGATTTPVSIPHAGLIAPVYMHLSLADAAEYHARTLESRPGEYTPHVRLRLEMGRHVLAEDYVRALRGKAILAREIDRALDGVDALVLPTLSIPAPPIGAETVPVKGGREPVRALMLRCTQPFNLSGHPALSLPCGKTSEGLPIGLQLVGRAGATEALLQTALAVERVVAG